MARTKTAPPRGLLSTAKDAPRVLEAHHARFEVDPPLETAIEHWWTVAWKLPPGVTHTARTLPHPSVHVIWEDGEVSVAGVPRGRFERVLRGEGRVFGAKFRPGGFRAVLGAPVASLTGTVVPFARVVGERAARSYARALGAASTDDERVRIATEHLGHLVPPPGARERALAELVALAATDRTLTTADALAARAGIGLRELQRRFRDGVGVSPKWVVARYRLHEAVERLERRDVTLAALAAELGYADQAHFTRDFKAMVGVPPSHLDAAGITRRRGAR